MGAGDGGKTVQYQMKLSYQSCEPSKKPATRPGPLAPACQQPGAAFSPAMEIYQMRYNMPMLWYSLIVLTSRMASVDFGP